MIVFIKMIVCMFMVRLNLVSLDNVFCVVIIDVLMVVSGISMVIRF